MRRTPTMPAAIALAVAAAVAAGGAGDARTTASGHFTAHVDNPWFPLLKGMRWEYRGVKEGRRLRDVVRVTGRVRRIDGAPCAVVEDRLFLDGRLAERTTDWYSQDAGGTVWYFGESTAELDRRGRVVTREGSWRAGVDGARAGIFMPAHPRPGAEYAQEHLAGHAEDRFRVISLHASVTVPYGRYRRTALKTREWTPLEPGVRDGKWYVKGIGEVRESSLRGPVERAELVTFRRP